MTWRPKTLILIGCGLITAYFLYAPLQNNVRFRLADTALRDQLSSHSLSQDTAQYLGEMGFRKSDTLDLGSFGDIDVTMSANDRLRSFAEAIEPTGVQAVHIIFREPGTYAPRQFWEGHFPGCTPSRCVEVARNVDLRPTTQEEHKRYRAGYHGRYSFELPESVIRGISYKAVATVVFDHSGAVTKLTLQAHRAFKSRFESAMVKLAGGGFRQVVFRQTHVISEAPSKASP